MIFGRACAQAVLMLAFWGRRYLSELPPGSLLHRAAERLDVAERGMTRARCDKRMFGLKDDRGELRSKPEEIRASHGALPHRQRAEQRDHRHRRGGRSERSAKPSQALTWKFAEVAAGGVAEPTWPRELDARGGLYAADAEMAARAVDATAQAGGPAGAAAAAPPPPPRPTRVAEAVRGEERRGRRGH